MNIPKYWVKETQEMTQSSGEAFLAQCWGWSYDSPGDARAKAKEALIALTRKVASNQRLDRYGYGERALREEIIQTVPSGSYNPQAVITRNQYGALVLNTPDVMFVDIDFEPEQGGLVKTILKLFGRPAVDREALWLLRIRNWMADHPLWGMRVYRTKAGLRCLVTHETFDPARERSLEPLRELGSDPLYITLCRNQRSFRARLTPKPWRCNLPKPPGRFPREDASLESAFQTWRAKYDQAIQRYTTCKLVQELGHPHPHPAARMITELHDQYACVNAEYALA